MAGVFVLRKRMLANINSPTFGCGDKQFCKAITSTSPGSTSITRAIRDRHRSAPPSAMVTVGCKIAPDARLCHHRVARHHQRDRYQRPPAPWKETFHDRYVDKARHATIRLRLMTPADRWSMPRTAGRRSAFARISPATKLFAKAVSVSGSRNEQQHLKTVAAHLQGGVTTIVVINTTNHRRSSSRMAGG